MYIQCIRPRGCLDKLIAQQFPLKSTEFVPGSPQYNEYISVIDKVCRAKGLYLQPLYHSLCICSRYLTS